MYNRRLLLLGGIVLLATFILTAGWAYPTKPVRFDANGLTPVATDHPVPTYDTSRNAGTTLSSSPSEIAFGQLYLATTVGGSNGVKLNPRALSFVQDYMKDNWDELQSIQSWCQPYFHLIENILTEYGLPKQLKYLAVIESDLKATAVSRVGAKGPWQLMPQTARDLGLKVNRKVDERKNYVKSTRAAALYLRDLYNQLGDWLLVIAAYNTGVANVVHAIHRSGSRNFWELQNYLPLESRLHVKRFIGTEYTFEGEGSVTTLTREEATEQLTGSAMYVFHRDLTSQEAKTASTITVTGAYSSAVIAKYTLMDSATFDRYNPDFDKVMASNNNSYDLKLPADKMNLFVTNKYEILTESVQLLAREAADAEKAAGVAAK